MDRINKERRTSFKLIRLPSNSVSSKSRIASLASPSVLKSTTLPWLHLSHTIRKSTPRHPYWYSHTGHQTFSWRNPWVPLTVRTTSKRGIQGPNADRSPIDEEETNRHVIRRDPVHHARRSVKKEAKLPASCNLLEVPTLLRGILGHSCRSVLKDY